MSAKPIAPEGNPDVPLPIAKPTEAEVWAADLELESDEEIAARETRIRQAAYEAAERRGFEPGHELEDWLAAEAEVGAGKP